MIQVMLGQLGIVTSQQMLSQWRWVVVGATAAAAVLTPSTDPFTQVRLWVQISAGTVGKWPPCAAHSTCKAPATSGSCGASRCDAMWPWTLTVAQD